MEVLFYIWVLVLFRSFSTEVVVDVNSELSPAEVLASTFNLTDKNELVANQDDSANANTAGKVLTNTLNSDKSNQLRYCPTDKLGGIVSFSATPKCPDPKDLANETNTEKGGTLFVFKPNIVTVETMGYRCYILKSVRWLDTDAWGHSYVTAGKSDIDTMEPVPAEKCKEWTETKKCTTASYAVKDNIYANRWCGVINSIPSDSEKFKISTLERDEKMNKVDITLYRTTRPILIARCMYNTVKSITQNCFMEEIKLKSSAPYKVIYGPNGMLTKKDRIFTKQTNHMATDSTYVWTRPPKPRVCDYILKAVYRNVTLNKDKNDNGKTLYVIVGEIKQNFVLHENQRVFIANDSYHDYCITTALDGYNRVKLYGTHGALFGYASPQVTIDEINDIIVNKTGKLIRRSLDVTDREEDKDEDMTLEENDQYENSVLGPGHKRRLLFDRRAHVRRKRALQYTAELYSPKDSAWLLGDQQIMSTMRYYIHAVSVFSEELARENFNSWCHMAKYKHQTDKRLARAFPSEIISKKMGYEVYARSIGDVYQIFRCRNVEIGEYTIIPTLRPPEQVNRKGVDFCYNRPLVMIYEPSVNNYILAQISMNQKLVIPPTYTETCIHNRLFYFVINGELFIYYNYNLVFTMGVNGERKAKTKIHGNYTITISEEEAEAISVLTGENVHEIDINDNDLPKTVTFTDSDVPILEPAYSDEELKSQMSIEDVFQAANRDRLNRKVINQFTREFTEVAWGDVTLEDVNKILSGIGKGVVSFLDKLANKVADFFFGFIKWFLGAIKHIVMQLVVIILVIMTLFVVIVGTFYFPAQFAAMINRNRNMNNMNNHLLYASAVMGKHIPPKQDNNYYGQKGQSGGGGGGDGFKKRNIRNETLFINEQEDDEEWVDKCSDKTPLLS